MSGNNIYIPGLFGDSNSSEAIRQIMEAKKAKLDKLEKENDELVDNKKLWNEIKQKTLSLQNVSKNLYGFDAPFDKKISVSSDENAFSASVTKAAEIGEYKLEILKKASSHKIAGKPLEKNFKIAAGEYFIKVGKDKYKITFSGGTVEKFAREIKEDSGQMLRATVTWNTPSTQVLILEAKNTGAKNHISFEDEKTRALFKKMDFFNDVNAYQKNFDFTESNVKNANTGGGPRLINTDTLLVKKNESFKLILPEKIPYRDNLIMEIDFKINEQDPEKIEEKTPTGPNFGKYGNIDIFDITIEGENPRITIPPYEKPPKPKIIEDDHYLEIVTDRRTIKLDELDVSGNNKTLKFDLNNIINSNETVEALIFKNNNTYKTLEASNIKIYDDSTLAGVKFKKEISRPDDAILKMDGIEVRRDTNSIDDLIKGMTLYIFDKTRREESLKIDRNYEEIVGTVTEFLGEYKEYLTLLNEETSTEMNDDDERGKFSGDYSLLTLVSKLRTIMMNPYPTSYGDELSMLAQIGVSTNVSRDFDASKLKGILEVDEKTFLDKMEKYPQGVKELFGYDSDEDFIIDTGIAFEVNRLLAAYTMKNQGVFDLRSVNYDRMIEQKGKDIEKYKEKMDKEEQDLKEKFYKMEKAAKELEDNTKKFDNLYKNK